MPDNSVFSWFVESMVTLRRSDDDRAPRPDLGTKKFADQLALRQRPTGQRGWGSDVSFYRRLGGKVCFNQPDGASIESETSKRRAVGHIASMVLTTPLKPP